MELKEVTLSQEGEDWLSWRREGIGASESAIIMGALPFKWNDVLELWKKKTGLVTEVFEMNEAMAQGKAMEPIAREKYSEVTGISIEPKCYDHPKFPFIKASLDGINTKGNLVVEIKCPGLGKFMQAKKGILVDYYYPQIQQQMACTNTQMAHYWVYREKEGAILMGVPRNDEYIEELEIRSQLFWDAVQSKKPILPRELGINMRGESDPYTVGEMKTELLGFYKN